LNNFYISNRLFYADTKDTKDTKDRRFCINVWWYNVLSYTIHAKTIFQL